MPRPFFALNHRYDGPPRVFRYSGLTVNVIGNTFGSLDSGITGGPAYDCAVNRVVQFRGANTFLALTGNQIYRSTDAGVTWTSVYTLTSLASNQTQKSGLNIVYINGVPNVCCVWHTSSANTYRGAYSSDGVTWTELGPYTVTGFDNSDAGFGRDYVYRNKLYTIWTGGNSGLAETLFTFDPAGNTLTGYTIANTNGAAFGGTLLEYNNRLMYVLANGNSSNNPSVATEEGIGSITWFTLGLGSSSGAGFSYAAFVYGDNLYFFVKGSAAVGWYVYEANFSSGATDISSTVIPGGTMSGSTDYGYAQNESGCKILIDGETAPGSTPNIYILFSRDKQVSAATTNAPMGYDLYKWNGPSSALTWLDRGGNEYHALTLTRPPQGQYFWSENQHHIEIVNRTIVSGGLRYSFILYSTSGAATVNVRAWRRFPESTSGTSATRAYCQTAATLSNPSAGILSGNSVTGLTADNTTVYQVTWDAISDGVDLRYGIVFEQYS